MTLERDDSLVTVVLVPMFVGVVGLLVGLTVNTTVGGLGFATGVVLALVVGANIDPDDETQERIVELEARVAELESERDDD